MVDHDRAFAQYRGDLIEDRIDHGVFREDDVDVIGAVYGGGA